ncbi:MAG: hypothetical protein HFH14_09075 [Lachnospiraceae bacterium]|nr:hypothetical protein [Lachnospiraceae bacterium]
MNNKKIDSMADKISVEISDVLADVMRPVFENLTKEISTLVAGLEDRQKENMKSMADAFLQEMAKTSGSMFESITADTADICRLQSDTVRELSAIVDKMTDDRAVLQKISEDNTRTAAKLTEIVEKIDDRIDSLSNVSQGIEHLDNGVADRISAEMDLYAELEKNSGNWAKQLAACNEMVAATSENAGSMVNESVGNAIANLDKCTEKLENISKGIESSYDDMYENMHAMMKEYRELVSKDMNDTFIAFDKNMSEIVKALGTAVADIADAADRIPKALKGSVDALQHSVKY